MSENPQKVTPRFVSCAADYWKGYDDCRADMEEILRWCYDSMNEKLVHPLMTYEKWRGQIQATIRRKK